MTERRQFLQGAASRVAALALSGMDQNHGARTVSDEWDLAWTERVTGKHRAVFDVADVESGFGVFRAAVWAGQCVDVLGAPAAEVSPVIVLRAHAVVLALQQSFWDRYQVGRLRRVTHPVTLKDTARNPVLMDAGDGLPPALVNATLPMQRGRGAIVLACNLALQAWVDAVAERERAPAEEARKQTLAALVPGVILQPSGVLAAVLAQDRGCAYIKAG